MDDTCRTAKSAALEDARQNLPWPKHIGGAEIVRILGLPLQQNRQLRRKLTTALSQIRQSEWAPADYQTEDERYGEALIALLRRPGGFAAYQKALRSPQLRAPNRTLRSVMSR